MTWILLKNAKILVGELANRLRELAIMIPKIRRRKVPHKGLQRPASKSSSAFLARSSSRPAPDILLDSLVPLIGNILLEPCGKLGELLRREFLDREFKFYRGHMTMLRQTDNTRNISRPNDPSSATAATRRAACNGDGPSPFAAAHRWHVKGAGESW